MCGYIGARSSRGGSGPAAHHERTAARTRDARAELRAHHEEIFQIRYAGTKITNVATLTSYVRS